jgi:NAD(P)H dehydrogenase (quinone)
MILITGANGNLGKATIAFLLKKNKPSQIAGLVRDLKKGDDLRVMGIEVRQGDYFDNTSLVKALKDVDQLLLVSSSVMTGRTKQHINVIDAAKESGVQHIYYTSMINPSPSSFFIAAKSHRETEEYIKSSGLPYTIFRDGLYFDNIPSLIGNALQSGYINYPAGNGKVSFAARVNMAEAIANVMSTPGHENRTYDLTANTSYSFNDIAMDLSELANRPIKYIDIPHDELKRELIELQTPDNIVELTCSMAKAIRHNDFNYPSPTLENLLGRKPIILKEFLRTVYSIDFEFQTTNKVY